MLTRLKVDGFKNLVGVDVCFGPFTCIAGVNGVGKSNLFDAIRFLSALAGRTIVDAASSVRDEGRAVDVRSVFHRVGDQYADRMSFEVEMIVPKQAIDDFGQTAKATSTFLRYALEIGWSLEEGTAAPRLEILREELRHITLGDTAHNLAFPHDAKRWRRSIVVSKRFAPYFISSVEERGQIVIRLHQDGGRGGQPQPRPARNLPRTVLSGVNAAEAPTVLCVRREMESWALLQLEPSALRAPDNFSAPVHLARNGAHLPATLHRIAARTGDASAVFAKVANRLAELIDDVGSVDVDRDEKRELLTLRLSGRDGTAHPARALSDGTLRFLALCVLEMDPESTGVLCLEEPENGIHPDRISAMLRLLRDIAVEPDVPVDADNPLRQVILNTHSPLVVAECTDDALLGARGIEMIRDGKSFRCVVFSGLPGTWREKADSSSGVMSRGQLLAYLNPTALRALPAGDETSGRRRRRVADREDLCQGRFDFLVAEPDADSLHARR